MPSLLRSALLDRRANVAMIFALCAPMLVAASGLAVDMSRLYSSRLLLQKSLDAAALAAAKEFGRTQDRATLEKLATDYFYANAGRDPSETTDFHYLGVTKENGQSVMSVSATRQVPMYFGHAITQFFGGPDKSAFTIDRSSDIVIQNRSVELALVLDNSGSMANAPAGGGSAKITTLKSATTDLVKRMMAESNSNVQFPVSMSVVPFSGAVNVGTQYASASWMDTLGISPGHNDDLDWDSWTVLGIPQADRITAFDGTYRWVKKITKEPLTRFYVYNRMTYKGTVQNAAWKGCVASRPNGYAITDDVPTAANPATLFMPTFAPSEHDWRGALVSQKNDWIPDDTTKNGTTGETDTQTLTRQRDVNKYFGTRTANSSAAGPNSICQTKALTPLTKTRATVLSAIADMEPKGGTNIMEGLAWGWRTLSAREPFTQGKPNGTEDNMKVLVLMTDGENTYNASYTNGDQVEMPNGGRSLYGTYGYAQFIEKNATYPSGRLRTGRMFDSTTGVTKTANIAQVTAAMNENMTAICENIKKDGKVGSNGSDGIVVFTIAFDLKDGSPVKNRLKACASNGVSGNGAKLYYDARNANDLVAAFSSITEEISSLRIAR